MGDSRSRVGPGFNRECASEDMISQEAHRALVAQEVARETAAAEGKVAELTAALTDAQNKLDVADTEKAAAITRAETAEAALVTYKAEQDTAREVAARQSERVEKVKAVAPSLDVTPERASRFAAMSDEDFAFQLEALELAAASGPHIHKGDDAAKCGLCGKEKASAMHEAAETAAHATTTKRETAMTGVTPKSPEAARFGSGSGSALRDFAVGGSKN